MKDPSEIIRRLRDRASGEPARARSATEALAASGIPIEHVPKEVSSGE